MASSTCCKCIFWLFTIWTRLVALEFCAFAFWACWEMRKLLVGDDAADAFEIEGDTLKVPLVLCLPTALVIDGAVYTTNSQNDASMGLSNCRSLDYMIFAVAMALLLSGVAVVIYLMVDACGRCGGHMDRNRNLGTDKKPRRLASTTSAGMCLLLLFMLVQTSISAGALVEQLNAWVDYVGDIIKNAPVDTHSGTNMTGTNMTNATGAMEQDMHNPAADIEHVEPLANLWILLVAASSAISAAFWILVDALIVYPCRPTSGTEDDFNNDTLQAVGSMEQQQLAMSSNDVGSEAYAKPTGLGNNANTAVGTPHSYQSQQSGGSGSVTSFGHASPSWTS